MPSAKNHRKIIDGRIESSAVIGSGSAHRITSERQKDAMNKPEPTADTLRTIPEAQAALKVSRGFIYILRDRGALEFVKLGRAARIRQSSIDRLIQAGAAAS